MKQQTTVRSKVCGKVNLDRATDERFTYRDLLRLLNELRAPVRWIRDRPAVN